MSQPVISKIFGLAKALMVEIDHRQQALRNIATITDKTAFAGGFFGVIRQIFAGMELAVAVIRQMLETAAVGQIADIAVNLNTGTGGDDGQGQ